MCSGFASSVEQTVPASVHYPPARASLKGHPLWVWVLSPGVEDLPPWHLGWSRRLRRRHRRRRRRAAARAGEVCWALLGARVLVVQWVAFA